MGKKEELRAGIDELRSVARRLNQWALELERAGSDHDPPAAGKEEKKALTLPEVRAILAAKCAAGYGAQVKALIESCGAASLKEVPAEKYGELLEAVKGLGEPLSTAGGGNPERGEVTRDKQSPQCGVAPIEGAEVQDAG